MFNPQRHMEINCTDQYPTYRNEVEEKKIKILNNIKNVSS